MAKREFIDEKKFFEDIQIQIPLSIAVKNNLITEQDIVKPYLDKITEHLGNLIDENMEVKGSTIEPNQYAYCYQEILEFIDSLLSEQGDTE